MHRPGRKVLGLLSLALASLGPGCAHRRPLLFPGDLGADPAPGRAGSRATPAVGVRPRTQALSEPGLAAEAFDPRLRTKVEGSID